ncbi:MAG: replication factor C small subunit [Candidatus Aenigmatarchaeota archaeon]|nr:MAG: replication factor C small subunit [Candidatus Aenigmarchaeota archaeon]
MFELWTEKYRPKKLDEIVGQEEVVKRLKGFVGKNSIPNLLFAGMQGTGKTTTALALVNELKLKDNFIETNASVTPDTPIMIREKGRIRRTNFGELADRFFKDNKTKYAKTENLEILSLDKDYNPKFLPVSYISRHKVDKIAKIKYEGGEIKTSLDHSVIILDDAGNLIPKKVSELKNDDLLISFSKEFEGKNINLNFEEFKPEPNPKIKKVLKNKKINKKLSWLFGTYLAEGCVTFRGNTSGQLIFVFGYPQEIEIVEKVQNIISDNFELDSKAIIGFSGFDRSKGSSIQVRIFNTQLAKFFCKNFYGSKEKNARTKRVPNFIYSCTIPNKIEFLKGYLNDGTGEFDKYVRYSSRSKENLIDIAWLGRLSGLNTTLFEGESRIVWGLSSYSHVSSELISAKPIINLLRKLDHKIDFNWRYLLRHQLYSKKSKRVTKDLIIKIINKLNIKDERIDEILKLVNSPIFSVLIKEIKIEKYDGFVYDVSVPSTEMFWGGTTPILLHNSDERGIDTIRMKIKDFARTKPIGKANFKIILLDEADALTKDAQQALRRTMENYSETCRFILDCNYSSKLIEPIQSRCVVFRFRPITQEDIKKYFERIEKGENIKIKEDAISAIYKECGGDLRKATNILQACASIDKEISEDTVLEVIGKAKRKDIEKLLNLAIGGKFLESRKKLYNLMIDQGVSPDDLLKQIYSQIFELEIDDNEKLRIIKLLADYEFRIVEGSNPLIQIEAFLANLKE